MLRHDLGHTAVRNLVTRHGVAEHVAMKITGHETRRGFDAYNIVSPGDLQDAARKMTGALPGAGAPSEPPAKNPLRKFRPRRADFDGRGHTNGHRGPQTRLRGQSRQCGKCMIFAAEGDGGRYWTRTSDLCHVRAAL